VETFAFGENWQRFLSHLTPERIANARQSLSEFTSVPNFRRKSFLDVGCGSGLFSLAAHELGAEKVVSFDRDALSVKCCEFLHEKAGSPSNWEIKSGSILDEAFLSSLGRFDVVYAWGVLHHTGHMYRAIENSAHLVGPGGLFYLALYNRVAGPLGSQFWLKVKQAYNRAPRTGKLTIEALYLAGIMTAMTVRSGNPVRGVEKTSSRGMFWRTDATDWLGGYPYEFASPSEIKSFFDNRLQTFELVKLMPTRGLGNNSFLFRNSKVGRIGEI
jgi:2-polyprenyl-3-methyl-5-hydroxy-6-metoxy-1,4-benzoquinol methylase